MVVSRTNGIHHVIPSKTKEICDIRHFHGMKNPEKCCITCMTAEFKIWDVILVMLKHN